MLNFFEFNHYFVTLELLLIYKGRLNEMFTSSSLILLPLYDKIERKFGFPREKKGTFYVNAQSKSISAFALLNRFS